MKRNIAFIVIVLVLSVAAVGVARFVVTRGDGGGETIQVDPADHGQSGHGESCAHDHAAGDGGSTEEAPGDLALSVEEILQAECEHGGPAHLCPDCQHEVGVVEVGSDLLGRTEGSDGGLVRVVPAPRSARRSVLNLTGEVDLNETHAVRVSPRVGGVVRSVAVDIGARVGRGDVLFEIESAELGRALSEYQKNRAMADLARRNYEREKNLFERKIASEWDMTQARMAFEEYQTELAAAEAALRVLGFDDADLPAGDPEDSRFASRTLAARAPIGGVIIDKHAVVGELVRPGDDLMLLADLSTVWVWADVYEQDLAGLIEARTHGPVPAEVRVHAFGDRVFTGEVDYVGATMERQTRTVKVRAVVGNGEGLLRPGMFCDIRIQLDDAGDALTVPEVSVLTDGAWEFVFKRLKEDYYVRRAVRRGRQFGDRVEIVEGVQPGELVVADGAFLLKSAVLRSKMGAG